jgi:orotidine-5'-phosphate decarboxylase
MEDSRIIVALDYSNSEQAWNLIRQLDPARCRVKVGKELFTCAGPNWVKHLITQGFQVFLDLKFHDIPNTVARACAAAAELGVWMLNIHALGGLAMMEAARDALANRPFRPKLLAVTLLTSMDATTLRQVGLTGTPEENVLRLARLANTAGLEGVVCSGLEAPALRQALGSKFLLVTPGIRPVGAEVGDQQRVLTPRAAILSGADYLVIGRPITAAPDPMAALEAIEAEIKRIQPLPCQE